MQRKKTLGYGLQAAQVLEEPQARASSQPASSPPSSPPSGIRLARPAIPRPTSSSVPPAPRSTPMPPANQNAAAAAATARAIAAIAATIPPPPPSGLRARSTPPPAPAAKSAPPAAKPAAPAAKPAAPSVRPAARSTTSAPPQPPRPAGAPKKDASAKAEEPSDALLLGDDEVTYVPDDDAPEPTGSATAPVAVPSLRATGQNWPLVSPLALAPAEPPRFGPPPSRPPAATLAGIASAPELAATPAEEGPAPSTPPVAPIPWVALAPNPPPADIAEAAAALDQSDAPAPADAPPFHAAAHLDLDEPFEVPFSSPAAMWRSRLQGAWAAASPRTRAALTFGAGFLAGALCVAIT